MHYGIRIYRTFEGKKLGTNKMDYIRYHYLFPAELSESLYQTAVYRDETSVVYMTEDAPQSIMDCSIGEYIDSKDLANLDRLKSCGLIVSNNILEAYGYTQPTDDPSGC